LRGEWTELGISVSAVNEGRRQKAEGRRLFFVTAIYTPLQKLFALKGEVLDSIVLLIFLFPITS
jgi:hypothetical protein